MRQAAGGRGQGRRGLGVEGAKPSCTYGWRGPPQEHPEKHTTTLTYHCACERERNREGVCNQECMCWLNISRIQRQSHPLWSVYRRQGVQVSHGELNALPLEVFINVDHASQVRAAPEGICPSL